MCVYLKTSSQFTILEVFSILLFVPFPFMLFYLFLGLGYSLVWDTEDLWFFRNTDFKALVERDWYFSFSVIDKWNNLVHFLLGAGKEVGIGPKFLWWQNMTPNALLCLKNYMPNAVSFYNAQHTWCLGSGSFTALRIFRKPRCTCWKQCEIFTFSFRRVKHSDKEIMALYSCPPL